MAQSGYTPISLYYTTTAAAVPTSGNLVNGELAINITDGKLYYKNNSGVVTLLAGATAGPAGGSNTQVQYNSSGALAGSANLTFNGTTLTANTIGAFTLGGTVAGGGNNINNVIIGASSPLAGAFTTLSASGETLIGGAQTLSAGLGVKNASATSTTTGDNKIIRLAANASGADVTLSFTDAISYNSNISAKANHLLLQPVAGTVVGDFSSTGLAVTGTLSATGTITSTNGLFNATPATATDSAYLKFTNTGGAQFIGADNSAGNALNSGIAYAMTAYTATNFVVKVNNSTITNTSSTGLAVTGTLSATGQISGTNTASYQAIFSGWGPLESNSTAGAIVVGGSSQNSGRGEIHYWNNSAPAPALYIDNTRNAVDGKVVVRLKTSATAVEAATFNIYGIGLTGTTPSSGTGITFPATQSASTDANTLDDYEEGTAQITLTATTGSITMLSGYDYIRYTKVGRLVTISGRLYVNSVSSPTTSLKLNGLPFPTPAGNTPTAETSFSVFASGLTATAVTSIQAFAASGGITTISIQSFSAGASSDNLAGNVQAGTQFWISGTYSV
jgi:hypothetical protein